jgi:SAM-dependent methyltransferase
MPNALETFEHAIVACEAHLNFGAIDSGMRCVRDTLAALRRTLPAQQWREVCASGTLESIRSILAEDPHVSRAREKPRGYPGDAVLLDYIYGCAPLPEGTTKRGRAIHRWNVANSVAFRSVRRRRRIVADHLNAVAARRRNARVLAVACGHLREAQLSAAVVAGDLGELVAIDRDPENLDVVRASCVGLPVRCVEATVGDVLKHRVDLGEFDLIYAAGLYDDLPDALARDLTATLASGLVPGGELLVANFVDHCEAAYAEAITDSFLLYRSESHLVSLARDVEHAGIRSWVDPDRAIAYLSLTRS